MLDILQFLDYYFVYGYKYVKIRKKYKEEVMSVFEKLGTKIDELLAKVSELRDENNSLRQEIVSIKAQCEGKASEISRLQELNAQKEREIEEIVSKIESMIG